jgi:hypothetical protein
MKKVLFLAVCACAMGFLGSAQAQVSWDASVSFNQPTGDFGDAFEAGFGLGGDVFYALSSVPGLGIGGRVAWNRFGVDDSGFGIDGGNMSIFEILPSARYSFTPAGSQFGFFGQAGLGMYAWNSTIETVFGDVEDDGTDFGFSIGGGATGRFTDTLSFVLMPLYHIINTEDESTNYFTLSFGIIY